MLRHKAMDIDLNGMFRYMVENFITKTEPSLSTIDILRLTPFVGNQLKFYQILLIQCRGTKKKTKNEVNIEGGKAEPHEASLIVVYTLAKALSISPLEIYQMPASLVQDLLRVHGAVLELEAEEMDKGNEKDKEKLMNLTLATRCSNLIVILNDSFKTLKSVLRTNCF